MRFAAALCALAMIIAMPSVASAETDPATAVQSLLDVRAAAITNHDQVAYMATIDPDATDTFRAAELKRYQGAQQVPLTELKFTVKVSAKGDLATGLGVAQTHNAENALLPETQRTYRLGEYDALDAVDNFWYSYVERDGRWYVASDSDAASIGLQNSQAIWDITPVVTSASAHFLVIADATKADRATAISAIAEESLARVQANWHLQWSEKVPIVVPANGEQAATLLRTDKNVANFVAFATYSPLRDGDQYSITAPRIFTIEDQLSKQSHDLQVGNFAHELTHIATALQAGPFTPTWLQEGSAELVRLNRPASYAKAANTTALPSGNDFSASGFDLADAYRNSTSAVAYLSTKFTNGEPERLFAASGQRRATPGTPAYNFDQAVQEALGVGSAELEKDWLSAP